MTRINNYNELVAERMRIEGEIERSKAAIAEGIHEIKVKFEPFLYLLPVLSVFKSKPSILKVVATLALNTLASKNLLPKSTWLTRFIIPIVKKII